MNKKVKILLIITIIFLTGCSKKIDSSNKKEVDSGQVMQNRENINDDNKNAEEDFLNQGSAKAIIDETDLWMFYEDKNTGFSLRYPHDIVFNGKNNKNSINLSIKIGEINSLDGTMGYNKEVALKNKKNLEQRNFGEDVDFPLNESKKLTTIDSINAQDFLVLSRFEVCDITFERKLYFFVEDFQVVITLNGPKNSFVNTLGDYLKTDKLNCGDQKMWGDGGRVSFFEDLEQGNAPEDVQYWYNIFDKIVKTMTIYEDDNNLSNIEMLQGKWISVDDNSSVIEFRDNEKIDYYGEEKVSEDEFTLSDIYSGNILEKGTGGTYLTVGSGDDLFEYSLVNISSEELVLTYLSRGNTLRYKK
jgi:hypothetical protein